MNKLFEIISKFAGFLLKYMARDLYNKRDNSLKEVEKIDKDTNTNWTIKQTNDSLSFLNKNIIELNCSTSVYSRVLTLLTFIMLILAFVMMIKGD